MSARPFRIHRLALLEAALFQSRAVWPAASPRHRPLFSSARPSVMRAAAASAAAAQSSNISSRQERSATQSTGPCCLCDMPVREQGSIQPLHRTSWSQDQLLGRPRCSAGVFPSRCARALPEHMDKPPAHRGGVQRASQGPVLWQVLHFRH
jgi:hypothetical protein